MSDFIFAAKINGLSAFVCFFRLKYEIIEFYIPFIRFLCAQKYGMDILDEKLNSFPLSVVSPFKIELNGAAMEYENGT